MKEKSNFIFFFPLLFIIIVLLFQPSPIVERIVLKGIVNQLILIFFVTLFLMSLLLKKNYYFASFITSISFAFNAFTFGKLMSLMISPIEVLLIVSSVIYLLVIIWQTNNLNFLKSKKNTYLLFKDRVFINWFLIIQSFKRYSFRIKFIIAIIVFILFLVPFTLISQTGVLENKSTISIIGYEFFLMIQIIGTFAFFQEFSLYKLLIKLKKERGIKV